MDKNKIIQHNISKRILGFFRFVACNSTKGIFGVILYWCVFFNWVEYRKQLYNYCNLRELNCVIHNCSKIPSIIQLEGYAGMSI